MEEKKDFSHPINESGDFRESWRIFRIMAEFVEGYQFLSTLKKEVTIFGSARFDESHEMYQTARDFGKMLGEAGFTTITGGGPGIMEAANRGAHDTQSESIGLNIQLPFEQRVNPYVTKSAAFYYFFTRKVMLTSPANAFVFFPGGYGTMDEFFEVVDLIELGKMHTAPIILIGKKYWEPLLEYLHAGPCELGSVDHAVVGEWHVVDTAEEAFELVKDLKDDHVSCELSPHSFQCTKDEIDWKIFQIMAELVEGFQFLTGLVENVTVLGTKSITSESEYYHAAHQLGQRLCAEEFAVITGGGPGTMEAANKGAFECGGESIGINMMINNRHRTNPYVKRSIGFQFPFTRKLIITAPSKSFVLFPGGFGTHHQLFEILTLIQTGKMQRVPVYLYGESFWKPLNEYIQNIFLKEFGTVGTGDESIYTITDDLDEIVKGIKDARPIKS